MSLLAWSPDGKVLAAVDSYAKGDKKQGIIKFWQTDTLRPSQLDLPQWQIVLDNAYFYQFDWYNNKEFVVRQGNNGIKEFAIWHVDSLSQIDVLYRYPPDRTNTFRLFSPDFSNAADFKSSEPSSIQLTNSQSLKLDYPFITTLAWSDDSTRLIVANKKTMSGSHHVEGAINVFDVSTAKLLHRIKSHFPILDIEISANKQFIATAGFRETDDRVDGAITVFDLETEKPALNLRSYIAKSTLAWHPEKQQLAIGFNNTLEIIDFPLKERPRLTPSNQNLRAIAWHPEGKMLATSHRKSAYSKKTIFMIVPTGEK